MSSTSSAFQSVCPVSGCGGHHCRRLIHLIRCNLHEHKHSKMCAVKCQHQLRGRKWHHRMSDARIHTPSVFQGTRQVPFSVKRHWKKTKTIKTRVVHSKKKMGSLIFKHLFATFVAQISEQQYSVFTKRYIHRYTNMLDKRTERHAQTDSWPKEHDRNEEHEQHHKWTLQMNKNGFSLLVCLSINYSTNLPCHH